MKSAYDGGLPNTLILCGYGMYVFSFAVWMQLLKETRLFIALSGASVVYITVGLASHLVLGEPIPGQVVMGTLFISVGVFLIGAGRHMS